MNTGRWLSGVAVALSLLGCGGGSDAPEAPTIGLVKKTIATTKRKAPRKAKRPARRSGPAQASASGSAGIKQLSVSLVYVDEGAGVWSCLDLAQGRGVIQQDDLEPSDFRRARGGVRLYKQRIYCFLDSEAGGDLVGYVRFLLGSLAALGGEKVDAALGKFRSPAQVGGVKDVAAALMHRDQSQLLLQENADGSLRLSFLDPLGRVPTERLAPYFDGLLIDRGAWIRATCDALDEYFQLVRRLKQQAVKPDAELDQLEALWSRANRELRKLAL